MRARPAGWHRALTDQNRSTSDATRRVEHEHADELSELAGVLAHGTRGSVHHGDFVGELSIKVGGVRHGDHMYTAVGATRSWAIFVLLRRCRHKRAE